MALRRGFSTQAEAMARRVRDDIGLGPADPIDIRAVAAMRQVEIVSADELVPLERLVELEKLQTFSFSACTFEFGGTRVIVVSPLRKPERQASDIGHELAHLMLEHDLTEVREIGGIPFRTCRADQEEEATALAGTLLLPRTLLLRAATRELSIEEIARTTGVTVEMARYRYNTTGVQRQVAARNRKR